MKYALLSLYETNSESIDKEVICHQSIVRYADQHGYSCFLGNTDTKVTDRDRYYMIEEALREFDRVVYLEPHMLVRFDTPDIFKIVPESKIGLFESSGCFPEKKRSGGLKALYDGSVIVASKQHVGFFSRDPTESFCLQVFNLPHKFNRLPITVKMTGEPLEDSYIVNLSDETVEKAMELADKFDEYETSGVPLFARFINIDAPGALGDCVATQPVVRYVKKLSPGAIVTVRTAFPEVFKGIGVETVGETDKFFVDGYYINLLPQYAHMSFNMMHPIDYAAIAAFGGSLPWSERDIILDPEWVPLPVSEQGHRIERHILIHPGRTWDSRTLPADWWNAVIQGFREKHYPVAIIGKTLSDGTRGTVAIDADGCLDLRDQLDLNGLMCAIKQGRMLITNDSSPVHISGAFSKPTIMITSAKHPDFIWPKRDPSLNITMGKPIAAGTPSIGIVNSTRLDLATDEEIRAVLPKPEEVVDRAIRFFRGE